MELKDYQTRVLTDLASYLEVLDSTSNLAEAFNNYWASKGVRVGNASGPGNPLPGMPPLQEHRARRTPHLCQGAHSRRQNFHCSECARNRVHSPFKTGTPAAKDGGVAGAIAQPRTDDDNTTFEKIRDKLVELKIPAEQIKIKTADINELKGVDLMSRDCQVRFIITVNALKEGWD